MKYIIISAPSGAGKTTIVRNLLKNKELHLNFSISATSRERRGNELDGKDYYFISKEEFVKKIDNNEFVEWEEVYKDHFYGTLKSEKDRIEKGGMNMIFDIDVEGGINLKNIFKNDAISIFIMPPSVEELKKRLRLRCTENEEKLQKRLAKAEFEIALARKFNKIVVNENIDIAIKEVENIVKTFLNK